MYFPKTHRVIYAKKKQRNSTKMISSTVFIILSSLISTSLSSPLSASLSLSSREETTTTTTTTTPSPVYPNGTSNPFYPCGSTAEEVRSCPYRCYAAPESGDGAAVLLPECYSEGGASEAIGTQRSICVKCEVVVDNDGGGGEDCAPVAEYFAGQRPSRCGTEDDDRLAECAWDCAAAQVPFDLCDAGNSTGPFRVCSPCRPQCRSPRIVFQPPASPPQNFSIAVGTCATNAQYGPPATLACPWRCTDAGNPNAYCSLADRSPNNGFTTCVKC